MNKVMYVDPIIGTVGDEKKAAGSEHGGGKTHPGACVPFGMVQLTPDTITAADNSTGYNYCNETIEGFSFNHMSGIGWYGDFGNLQIMPVVGETDLRSGSNAEVPFVKGTEGWKSPFSHDNEKAEPGYYSVKLDKYGILAEATVTTHCGMLKFTYPENSDRRIIFNFSRRIAGHADFESVTVKGKIIEGVIKCTPAGGGFGRGEGQIKYNYHFSMELSEEPKQVKFFENEEYFNGVADKYEGADVGMVAVFESTVSAPIFIRCGVSYVDLDGARNNLACEMNTFDFDKVRCDASEMWEKAFDCISVEGSNKLDMKLFYTCLYHVFLDPRTAADADGRFVLQDESVEEADFRFRTIFSGWDVYRSNFPLLTVISPDVVNDEVNSLLKIALNKNSSLPRWEIMAKDAECMVGDPGLLVSADAYLKGIADFDIQKVFELSRASSLYLKELYGKPFHSTIPPFKSMIERAYRPANISITLEYLLFDHVMAKLAKKLGREDDAIHFKKRADSYPENYDPKQGFMIPRDEDGNFIQVDNEYVTKYCIEANIFQQTWFVPYDVKGLSKLMGEERTLTLLERLFSEADFSRLWNENYNHSNEPCHNITHYFDILGKPERTQYWTRRVQKEAYREGAFGFCGNEDVGQLSSWYVLSALGFAQVCIGNEEFYINTPLFKKASIKLNEKYHTRRIADTFTVECDKDPDEYGYISEMYLNGKKLDRYYLTYSEITDGGVLEMKLSKEPVV